MDNTLAAEIKERCKTAALLTETWMLDHLKTTDLYSKGHKDPVSYYKWPLTLLARGREKEAKKLFHWICEKSLSETGDFTSNRAGFHLEFHNYANLLVGNMQ